MPRQMRGWNLLKSQTRLPSNEGIFQEDLKQGDIMSEDNSKKPMTKVINLKELVEPKEVAEAVLGIYVAQCIRGCSTPDPKAFLGINIPYKNLISVSIRILL